jgi:hypothetical protein
MARRKMKLRTKVLLGVVAILAIKAYPGGGGEPPAAADASGIPTNYKTYYKEAAATVQDYCPQMDWQLLAGVGWIETHHGTLKDDGVLSGENYAGAGGPMQFLQSTWDGVQERHPDIGANRYDPHMAARATAYKLCDDGVKDGDVYGGLFAYNHLDSYVRDVQNAADGYRG